MNYDQEKIWKFSKLHKIMSWPHDNLIEYLIIKSVSPNTIWEIGAGTGNWCMLMDHMLRPDKVNFHMVEDFKWNSLNLKFDYFWPRTPKEFTENIESTQSALNQDKINSTYYFVDEKEIHNKLDELIDVIRIDVDVADPDSTMKWILDNGSKNLIVIVDDTVEISRVMMMQEQIELGNLKLLWWGINSAAWCRTDLNSDDILNSIVETPVEHFKQFQIRDQKFMRRNNKFLITWPTGTFHELLR